jgi:hypothetical protein
MDVVGSVDGSATNYGLLGIPSLSAKMSPTFPRDQEGTDQEEGVRTHSFSARIPGWDRLSNDRLGLDAAASDRTKVPMHLPGSPPFFTRMAAQPVELQMGKTGGPGPTDTARCPCLSVGCASLV